MAGVAGVAGRDSTGATDGVVSLDFSCTDEEATASISSLGFSCTDEVATVLVSSLEASLAAAMSSFPGDGRLTAVLEVFWSGLG